MIFVAIMAATLGIVWLINNFFLEKYYIRNKEKTIFSVYEAIENECANGDVYSDQFDITLQSFSNTHNVSIVILTSLFEPVKVYANESSDALLAELRANLFGTVTAERVIMKNDSLVMFQKYDKRMQTEYIEMCGVLSNGNFFLMRTTVESIKNSAEIASRFMLYIGLGMMVLSAVAIYFFTGRISKPILRLADISNRMSEMDFTAKYNGREKTEIALLGQNINTMSANLERTIGELKSANEQLKADIDLKERIDEMRKEFISNASHELKTPIALIQGYAEGLKEGVNEAEERDYYCDVIIDEASKMNVMVKKLLTLNQLESGADNLDIEKFDICTLINNYVQSSEILTKQNNINVTVRGPESIMVKADEFKIEEVVMNYFSNAINHCESKTQKAIDVSLKKEENKVRVSIFNTGNAIPEESLDHLFEKFYKVDKARTREYGGSGVGLSIVKAIMDSHGCEYGVYNEEEGVCFWFELETCDE